MSKRKPKGLTLEQRYRTAAEEFAKKVGPIVEIATIHGDYQLAQRVLSRITYLTGLADRAMVWPAPDDPINHQSL